MGADARDATARAVAALLLAYVPGGDARRRRRADLAAGALRDLLAVLAMVAAGDLDAEAVRAALSASAAGLRRGEGDAV